MAYDYTRVQSSRSQVSNTQPQAQRGWLGRAVDAVKEAFNGPTVNAQGTNRGPDHYEQGARIDINRPRQLTALNNGRGPNNSRGLQRIVVPDSAILGFLDTLKDH